MQFSTNMICTGYDLHVVMRKNIIVIFVKEKDIQAFGIITAQRVIILLTLNVFFEYSHLSKTESLGRIITGTVIISFLSRRLMATLSASIVVSFVEINPSSV